MNNKLCYICSPYQDDTERNVAYAKELTRLALDNGYAPIAPHLYLTQVLNEEVPEQREIGMNAGMEILHQCRYIIIGSQFGISEGMSGEIDAAIDAGLIELAVTKNGLETVYGYE